MAHKINHGLLLNDVLKCGRIRCSGALSGAVDWDMEPDLGIQLI
jgi:hypothetical protein